MSKQLILFLIFILIASMLLPASKLSVVAAVENSWTTKKPMPTARGGLGIAVVYGKLYAIGGLNDNTQLAVNEEYNPVTDTWAIKMPMPTARSGFAIVVYQNKIYCIGGTVGDGNDLVSGFTGVNEVYDPIKNTWETKAPMPTPRSDLHASVIDGKIYLIGGKEYWEFTSYYHEIGINEIYDPESDSWTTNSQMPVPVFGYGSSVVNGKIFFVGGARQFRDEYEGLTVVSSNQVYEVANDTWSNRARVPTAVSHGAAGATSGITAPKKIYIVGGYDQFNYSNVTYAYDFEDDSWSNAAPLLTSRRYLAIALVDDILYAIGGFNGDTALDVNEQYLPLGYGTVPPDLQVLSPENTTYTSNITQLVLSVNRPVTWIGYSLDGQDNVTINGDIELSDISEGQHSITVYVNDTFANMVSSSTVYFSVDTMPPQIVVLSPKNTTYGASDIQSAFSVDEPVSWIGYSLDGQDNVTVNGNITLAVLAEGSHNIKFFATDLVGNTGYSETIYFEITPFPTVLFVAIAVTITITTALSYLLLKRRKSIRPKQQK
ncbi:MAG: hypothetical protein NWE80_01915 [Candidatus Bathyarchaeota archaeon]|nr:hypothetical protein [Candidatus Bathyarchaeota archaeon]